MREICGNMKKNLNFFTPFSLCLSAQLDFISWERSMAENTEPRKQECLARCLSRQLMLSAAWLASCMILEFGLQEYIQAYLGEIEACS